MTKLLSLTSAITLLCGCWLALMECLLRHPGFASRATIALLIAAAGMATLLVLVRHDLGDAALARRSVWLLALAPPAFTLVMGYAEGVLLLCTTVSLLAASIRIGCRICEG